MAPAEIPFDLLGKAKTMNFLACSFFVLGLLLFLFLFLDFFVPPPSPAGARGRFVPPRRQGGLGLPVQALGFLAVHGLAGPREPEPMC